MTAKEKAIELYNKCNPHCLTVSFYGDNIERQSTKRCALIAVDEVMGAIDAEDHVILYNYWQQVRTELENL